MLLVLLVLLLLLLPLFLLQRLLDVQASGIGRLPASQLRVAHGTGPSANSEKVANGDTEGPQRRLRLLRSKARPQEARTDRRRGPCLRNRLRAAPTHASCRGSRGSCGVRRSNLGLMAEGLRPALVLALAPASRRLRQHAACRFSAGRDCGHLAVKVATAEGAIRQREPKLQRVGGPSAARTGRHQNDAWGRRWTAGRASGP